MVKITREELLVAIDEMAQGVDGRRALRVIFAKHDKRFGADKSKPVAHQNPDRDAGAGESLAVHIGSILRDRRFEAGLTQSQLADKLGVNKHTLLRWEAGAVEPGLDTYEYWARALKTSLREIL